MIHQGVPESFVELHGDLGQFCQTKEDAAEGDGGGCPLCNPCKQTEGKPCTFPEKKISCMSAYCVDVGKLAKKCELPFAWANDKMHLFGLIAFHKKA